MRSSALILLLVLQSAAGSWACQAPELKCDFVCDCTDCSDEQDCGYRGKGFECDFEDAGMCGWSDQSSAAEYKWERLQRGDTMPDSGPSSDYTTGTAMGWFMGVSAVKTVSSHTALLTSPEVKQSSPTCRLRLRYFLWDSGHTGLGSAPLWASILHKGSGEAVVWRPEPSSIRNWREATIFLGRIPSPFKIRLHSQRSEGRRGDVAIDQLEFLDCALPSPPAGESCPEGTLKCKRGNCVEQRQVCDGTDDCGDGTDEETCGEYQLCDFEDGLCEWKIWTFLNMTWVRTNQMNISTTDPLKGPGRDHSQNSASGHFLYVTIPETGLTNDWTVFQSPKLEPTNSSHPCKMVMYTHQFGPRSGGLTVLVIDRYVYPVWERGGSLGDLWVKAEAEIVSNHTFQILIMAAIRDYAYGGVAVDSIILSPACRLSSGSTGLVEIPKPPKHPCTEPQYICDFHDDCPGAEDEAKCGDFSYPEGSSGWTDRSIGSQGWVLYKNSTNKEEYLYVAKAMGQQLTEAQTRTPLLGSTGPACNLSFDFALTGDFDHIGELSVRVIDSLLGVQPKLWEFSGKTGTGVGEWKHADILVGVREHRFQLAFEARAVKLGPLPEIKVKNITFTTCHADYYPSFPTGLSCNFEDGMCGWYQDNSDNFDWMMLNGMDHTIGPGRSLAVDMWNPSLRGAFGRLISFPQSPHSTERCLYFYYKLYGPNTGTLYVKLSDMNGHETVLWTRSGSHGNAWHEAKCPVPDQLTNFQLIFEAVRSGFDGQVAIDDVVFMDCPCTSPRMCSFEGQSCGYSSSGTFPWIHTNGNGSLGPKTDHTLETEQGSYMVANTGIHSGGTAVLVSPVHKGITKTECVHFWYHIGGVNPGSLTVYMKPVEGQRVKIFSNGPKQGNVWRLGNGNISSAFLDWQLEFEALGGKDTHIAVDDIYISPHPCEDQGSKCTMEKGMCGWSNTQNVKADTLDWVLTSHETEQHYSTPTEDHTMGTEKGHFLFLPTTNRTPTNQNARLLSPHLPPTKGTCLRFWAYKQHSSDSKLFVWRLSGGLLHELLEVSEVGGLWKRFDVNMKSSEEYQIVLEGIKGTAGVVALDDIEYTIGVNCANTVTDSIVPIRDNAGGIAASVIVVLLLIATLAALLVYYLRTRQKIQAASGLSPTGFSVVGFSNKTFESNTTQDSVTTTTQNHPMAAGFNDVQLCEDMKEVA